MCSVSLGDSVCRGCKRFEQEVLEWNTSYANTTKQAVERRLTAMLLRVTDDLVTVTDVPLLQSRLNDSGVAYARHRDPKCWVWDALRLLSESIEDPKDYGFIAKPNYQHLSMTALCDALDGRFYDLAVSYYRRYVGPANFRNDSLLPTSLKE